MAPAVDFYVLDGVPAERIIAALGKILTGLWQDGARSFVLTQSARHSEEVDAALWTYDDISFLPHARLSDPLAADSPVLIGEVLPEAHTSEVLVNLSGAVPPALEAYHRVVELVCGPAAERSQSRQRYRQYRDLGCELNTHK